MPTPKAVRTTLISFVVIAIAAVFLALACAPAAPENQNGESEQPAAKPTATALPSPTPTPEMVCHTAYDPQGNPFELCQYVVEPVINESLQGDIDQYMAKKENEERAGRSIEPKMLDITIITDGPEHVDALVKYLKANTHGAVRHSKHQGPKGSGASAYVSIEQIPTIAAMEGVTSVYETPTADPAGYNQQGTLAPAALTRAEAWHATGVSGTTVQVGIIDHDFRDFKTRILPIVTHPVRWLCYDAMRMAIEGNSNDPTANFAPCERAHSPPLANPHGTEVAAAALETAPDAQLLISNANTPEQVQEATNWLTAKATDNAATDALYTVGANDDFDVRIINYSQTGTWDGPGNGTSPFTNGMDRSVLHTVDTAVQNGVIWVNAAGNRQQQSWFKRTLATDWNSSNQLKMNPSSATDPCNYVSLARDKTYNFQLRWAGPWQNADTDLNLALYGPYGPGQTPTLLRTTGAMQDGENDDRSGETLDIKPADFPTNAPSPPAKARYCLLITRVPGEPNPAWVQLMSRTSGTPFETPGTNGAIENPAESNNDGMLAVGASDNSTTPTIKNFSARGPAPEPHPAGRIKPEVVSYNTTRDGTSFSSPRVAGLAALAIEIQQTLGRATTPTAIATYIKDRAKHTGTGSPANNVWGHGLAVLPNIEKPTNVRLTHIPCGPDGPLQIDFDHDQDDDPITDYIVRFYQRDATGRTGEFFATRTTSKTKIFGIKHDRGAYDATAQVCIDQTTLCGPESDPSPPATIAHGVCTPEEVKAVPGNGRATVSWNPDPDATTYEIRHAGGTRTTSDTFTVFDKLTNGTSYAYEVRTNGAGGPSDWSRRYIAKPEADAPGPETPFNLQPSPHNISRGFPGTRLTWISGYSAPGHEVRIWDGTTSQWKRTPFTPQGWNTPYEVTESNFRGGTEAIISGLIPGTQYAIRVRGSQKKNSREASDRSAWSDRTLLTTTGSKPSDAPAIAAIPKEKAPPSGLTATVTTDNAVNLTWTAQTNPNYTKQYVLRRVARVLPTAWTRIEIGLTDTAYTDRTASPQSSHVYRIRAEKANAKGGDSNAVTVDIN